jgi:hypothetical protein
VALPVIRETIVKTFCFALAMLTSVPTFAEERPKTEFSAGYDFLRLTGDAAQNLPSGWYGEIASNMTV